MSFHPKYYPVDTRAVLTSSGTLRPATPEGDAFFGLEMGTNGTAASARREAFGAGPWERFDGSPATGLTLVPTNRSQRVVLWGVLS